MFLFDSLRFEIRFVGSIKGSLSSRRFRVKGRCGSLDFAFVGFTVILIGSLEFQYGSLGL